MIFQVGANHNKDLCTKFWAQKPRSEWGFSICFLGKEVETQMIGNKKVIGGSK